VRVLSAIIVLTALGLGIFNYRQQRERDRKLQAISDELDNVEIRLHIDRESVQS